jgi:hypothetical protein
LQISSGFGKISSTIWNFVLSETWTSNYINMFLRYHHSNFIILMKQSRSSNGNFRIRQLLINFSFLTNIKSEWKTWLNSSCKKFESGEFHSIHFNRFFQGCLWIEMKTSNKLFWTSLIKVNKTMKTSLSLLLLQLPIFLLRNVFSKKIKL